MVHLFRLARRPSPAASPRTGDDYTGTAGSTWKGRGVLLRLYGKTLRTWATAPGWLRGLVAREIVLAPVRELLEEVLR